MNGENRVTQAGRRFYRQSYARYIVHVPIYLVRRSTGARFREDHYDITGEQLGMDVELNARGSAQEQLLGWAPGLLELSALISAK